MCCLEGTNVARDEGKSCLLRYKTLFYRKEGGIISFRWSGRNQRRGRLKVTETKVGRRSLSEEVMTVAISLKGVG